MTSLNFFFSSSLYSPPSLIPGFPLFNGLYDFGQRHGADVLLIGVDLVGDLLDGLERLVVAVAVHEVVGRFVVLKLQRVVWHRRFGKQSLFSAESYAAADARNGVGGGPRRPRGTRCAMGPWSRRSRSH